MGQNTMLKPPFSQHIVHDNLLIVPQCLCVFTCLGESSVLGNHRTTPNPNLEGGGGVYIYPCTTPRRFVFSRHRLLIVDTVSML